MQIVVNGTVEGVVLGLLALAFMMVYSGTNIFYLGLAGVYAVVPYIVLECTKHRLPLWFSIMIGAVIGVMISILCELINHWPLEKKKVTWAGHLISSLGIYIIIIQVVTIVWGSEMMAIEAGRDGFSLMGVILSHSQAVNLIGSLSILLVFYFWLKKSRLGLQLRALADNSTELALFGYNVRSIRIILFGISGLLASSSSLFTALDQGFRPTTGLTAVFLAYVALIIGGKEKFSGAILGGLLIGNIRSITIWFLSSRWQDPVTFAILALFLLFRPYGILGSKNRIESE